MAVAADLRARNAAFWEQAAPGWITHADRQDEIGRPLGAAAIDWLRPREGERILDVGCGCGGATAELARAVGSTGGAVGLDLAEAMVVAARNRFARCPAAEFITGDVETLGVVPGAPFDAVHSRMTLMLLADPIAGLTTIRRSLRPGGRLAATVFRDGGVNPWLAAAMLGAAAHVGPLPPLPIGDEPGPFALADPARVRAALDAAGFVDVDVEPRDVVLVAPDEPDAVADWLIEIGPAGAAYRTASPSGRAGGRAGAVRLLERFREAGTGYRLPAGLWLITATVTDAELSQGVNG
jgi:SAM-dependent methyltransferase